MKIIHIIENLDKGAVENWLVNVFLESRKIQPEWKWTFYCILGKSGRLDQKVREAGGEIIYAPCSISEKKRFLLHLRKTLKTGGFDILHSHHDYLSGFYLIASTGLRFKKRLLHIHNTDKGLPVQSDSLRKMLLILFKRLAYLYSDLVIGISNNTLEDFAGKAGIKKINHTVLYYGIDLKRFSIPSGNYLKKELSIPEEGKLLLFVGRLNKFKNPVFVIDILRELYNTNKDIYAVFVGKGGLENDIMQRAQAFGLANFIRLIGWRDDIAAIMKTADVFIFPRLEQPKEGLGLVVVEAQAAGLPMVLSNGIVQDAIEINDLTHFMLLNNNPQEWASQVARILDSPSPINRQQAYERMMQSKFELTQATRNLLALYE